MCIRDSFICVGTVLYIPLAMGGGPRDSLMLALAKRFPKVRIGVVRGCIEGTVLSIGWLFGAKVGIGTVIAVFGIGTMLQLTCTLFHSDLKGVVHESCLAVSYTHLKAQEQRIRFSFSSSILLQCCSVLSLRDGG